MLRKFNNLILSIFLFSQATYSNNGEGSPYVSNIDYFANQQNYVWDITQTPQGTILIAGKTGLYEFDSESWEQIETPDVPLTVFSPGNSDRIYISGRNYIGYLDGGTENSFVFKNISSGIGLYGNFTHCKENDTNIFFCSRYQLVCVSKEDNEVLYSHDNRENTFLGVFTYKKHIFLNVRNEGVFMVSPEGLTPVNLSGIENQSIIFCTEFSDDYSLIGTDQGNLFLFNKESLIPYTIKDSEFLQTGILSAGVSIDSNRLAISSNNFGVIIIDKNTRKTINTLNYRSGLPNNFITHLFIDRENGLWIAHPNGLSRIDTKLPLYYYSSYPGLNSGVQTINYWEGKLHVATTTGVFILDSINYYDTEKAVKRIPVKNKPGKSSSIANKEKPVVPAGGEQVDLQHSSAVDTLKEKPKRGFLKRLFSKKDQAIIEDNDPVIDTNKSVQKAKLNGNAVSKVAPVQKYELFRYEKYVLKSKEYGFAKVSGIDRRTKLLIPFKKTLLAVTDSKIYTINKEKNVEEIFSNIHIYTVLKSGHKPSVIYVVTESGVYIGELENKEWAFELLLKNKKNLNATDIVELDEESLLLALPGSVLKYSIKDGSSVEEILFNPYLENVSLKKVDNKVYIIIGNTLYELETSGPDVLKIIEQEKIKLVSALKNQENHLWLDCENNVFKYFGKSIITEHIYSFLKIFDNITDIHLDGKGNLWIVENFENLYQINLRSFEIYEADVKLLIKKISTINSGIILHDGQKLKYADNAIEFSVVAPSFLMFNSNQYQYIIEGLMSEWSEWTNEHVITVPYFPPGQYTFKIKARNLFGKESEIKSFSFKITPPFWKTPLFYISVLILVISSLYFLQRYRMKKHLLEKEILQQKVKERTIELELKNKAITDSIIYAERIQMGMLPSTELINSSLGGNFIVFMPRNIVSGDFYWLALKDNLTFVVAADCTGHGVPGAFMSMLGIAYLNEIVRKAQPGISAAEVLEKLRERIVKLFSQEAFKTNDGMDIALLIINSQNREMQYSGAYNPLYQITSSTNPEIDKDRIAGEKNGHTLVAYKADRFHVGKASKGYKKFTNHIIKYNPEDTFYIFSDGYVDQFGGEEETKFKFGPFKRLILDIHDKPMGIQKEAMVSRFNDWKMNYEQTDDVLVWGFRVK